MWKIVVATYDVWGLWPFALFVGSAVVGQLADDRKNAWGRGVALVGLAAAASVAVWAALSDAAKPVRDAAAAQRAREAIAGPDDVRNVALAHAIAGARAGRDYVVTLDGGTGELVGPVDRLALQTIRLGGWIMKAPAQRLPEGDLVVVLSMKAIDKYGAESRVPALTARWPAAEVAKVAWETISKEHMLALAHRAEYHAMIEDDVRQWCDKVRGRGALFCTRAALQPPRM